ncbi:MAG TPA: CdaR family protein [Patescibacteria group bacterium]|nr:CdaR family protein [Patescibacteria group bacterium]
MGFLLRNWHLKLSAVLLATVLYTGIVFSGAFDEATIQVRIEQVNQPANSYVLTGDLGFVEVRYRAAQELLGNVVAEAAFVARVDLSSYDMDDVPAPQVLDVEVRSLNENIEVLSVEPDTVRVEIDQRDQRMVPVEVDFGTVPEGLEVDEPETSADEVQVRGPASVVAQVDRVVALVNIDASGIDFDRPVTVVPVDIEGQPIGVGLVEVDPQTIAVRIDVQAVEETRTVPVRPVIDGTPAPGFALEAFSVSPQVVTLRGLPAVLAEIPEVVTEPLSIENASADDEFEADLVLPDGVELVDGEPQVTVAVTIGPSVSSRTFVVGVLCVNAGSNACLPGIEQLSLTLSGPGGALSGLSAADLTPALDAEGLAPGSYSLTPIVPGLPEGVELIGINPGAVPVTIVAPATPAPEPTPEP